MFAKITKDKLVDGTIITESHVGTRWGSTENQNGPLVKFRLLDDDGEVYYYGEGDDDSLEVVFNWAMRDSGCTSLEVRDANGNWQPTIG